MPEKLTVTSVLLHPLTLASGVRVPLDFGAVLSILTAALSIAEAVFPASRSARSADREHRAFPTVVFLPATTRAGLGKPPPVESIPDSPSDVVKAEGLRPCCSSHWRWAPGLGAPKFRVGAVLSMLMPEADAGAAFPARSVQLPDADCFGPLA